MSSPLPRATNGCGGISRATRRTTPTPSSVLAPRAIGRLPQGFVQNAPDTAGYARAVAAGRFATVKGIALSDDDRLRASIIERLMCDLEVDLDAFGGASGFAAEIGALRALAGQGLLRIDGRRIVVTQTGRPFVRIAASVFDAYLTASAKRHSAAV